METECDEPISNNYDGFGVELDWLRQFWDVHTDGSSPPGMTSILNWIEDATSWSDTQAYEELNTEANTVGGTLNSIWDNRKGHNGIDH